MAKNWDSLVLSFLPHLLKLKVKITQSCLTLCDPMGYIFHRILQARMLEWVAYPFSRGSSWPRNWTRIFCIAGRFFTNWAIREAWYMYIFFIHSSVIGHLGYFHGLAIVNSVAMKTGVHDSFWIIILSGYMLKSGISRSYGKTTFSFLKNLHTVFNSGCNNLHSHNSVEGFPFLHILSIICCL